MTRTNLFVFIAGLAIFLNSCSKDDDRENSTNGRTTAVFNPDVTYGTLTDQEGNVYKTVTIGGRTWMAENLRTTIYNDGTPIPMKEDGDEWIYLNTGAYCNYNNTTSTDTIATFGRLYNWHAVNTGKLAPDGWHVATESEWDLIAPVSDLNAAKKLKETGDIHWLTNPNATNETGFTALPGGLRDIDGSFKGKGTNGYWWTANDYNDYAWFRRILFTDGDVKEYNYLRIYGFSVRCVKD